MASLITKRIEQYRITSFFVLTYTLSWTLDAIPKLLEMNPSWGRWFIEGFLSPLSPGVAAAIVLWASGESVRKWLSDVFTWRVHPKWYAAAILIPFAITYAAGVASWALGGPIDWAAFDFDPITIVIGIILGTFIGGGQEEFGWRGFAQPELQERYGGLSAALIIGVFWGLWHLPQFIPGGFRTDWPLELIVAYFVGIIAFSVLLGWVFNGSNGSVLLAMLMHGTDNATTGQVPLDLDIVFVGEVINWSTLVTLNGSHAVITWAVVLLVVIATGVHLYDYRVSPDWNTEP
ncbi:CPBP family intramembrane glutamic endopeptidase [Haloarcula nitratireducens]|uniref:CPBP family intramembrane metalloprotease n=1 Tax=Haloarcula nitratireducens TaxID=2487749 RepID=A0AAW4PHP5_9EURY|nr:type II CAAX endopeptidase family protein [Halomicroarcula nitratireducens]MBX0297555.1 CPBP family intramembrane metalloprotease [Halomicroarcula nitratireducens]